MRFEMPAVIVFQEAKEGSSSNSSSSRFENSEKATMSSRHAETEGDYTQTIHRLYTDYTRTMHGKSNVK
jgi:hypothetical protein